MKKKSVLFLVFLGVMACAIFLITSLSSYKSGKSDESSLKGGGNPFARTFYEALYSLGISINPKEVIVGKNGWLYATQISRETIVVDKEKYESLRTVDMQDINFAMETWRKYLNNKGVDQFNILIIPDKRALYPEFLPSWAVVNSRKLIDTLQKASDSKIFLDSFNALLDTKANQRVFFKTDSMLTAAGGIATFQFLSQEIKKTTPEIQWLLESSYELRLQEESYLGSLSQKIKAPFSLAELKDKIYYDKDQTTTISTFNTKQHLERGVDSSNTLDEPILVTTKEAQNKKKALWVQDSSSLEMIPLMAATSSEVLIVRWSNDWLRPDKFASLIDEYKPNYVFWTLNEQNVNIQSLYKFPPSGIFNVNGLLANNYLNDIPRINNLKQIDTSKYKIKGKDPHIVFNLKQSENMESISKLFVNITCTNNPEISVIPIQFFWRPVGKAFSEKNSANFSVKTTGQYIDLNSVVQWKVTPLIDQVRLDIDAPSCSEFQVHKFLLGN